MTSYDSDSSGEDDGFTETSVLLGYAAKEPSGDSISHLGGQPQWIDSATAPSGAFAKCKACNSYLSLLLELDANIPEHFPGHERRLYVWSCRRKACRRKPGSIRSLRSVRYSKNIVEKQQSQQQDTETAPGEPKKPAPMLLGDSLFGAKSPTGASSNVNPFSSSTSAAPSNSFGNSKTGALNPFAPTSKSPENKPATNLSETFASKVRISVPDEPAQSLRAPASEPWPAEAAFPVPYPYYHLDAEYETLDAPRAESIPANARMEIDGESSTIGVGKEDKELFESTLDRTFQKFADRMAQNPEQVLRYEFRGIPLLYSKADSVGKALGPAAEGQIGKLQVAGSKNGMPRCQNCGSERVFELQLTPHAITELEAEELSLEGMEWGTIIVGVCSKNCKSKETASGEIGYLEEWVGVQWEETKPR